MKEEITEFEDRFIDILERWSNRNSIRDVPDWLEQAKKDAALIYFLVKSELDKKRTLPEISHFSAFEKDVLIWVRENVGNDYLLEDPDYVSYCSQELLKITYREIFRQLRSEPPLDEKGISNAERDYVDWYFADGQDFFRENAEEYFDKIKADGHDLMNAFNDGAKFYKMAVENEGERTS